MKGWRKTVPFRGGFSELARIKKIYFETNKPRLKQDTLYDFVVHGLRGREVTSMRGPPNTDEKQLMNITKAETLNVHML